LLREAVRDVRDAELRQDLGGPLAGAREREPVEQAHQEEVVAAAQALLDRRLLEDDPHLAPDRVALGDDVPAEDPGRARGRRPQGRQDREERGLARAVRPEEREHLAPADRQVDAPERLDLAVVLGERPDLDGGDSGFRRSGRAWVGMAL
jgi:hypothetical protein